MFGIKGVYKENFIDESSIAAKVEASRAVRVNGTNGSLRAQVIAGKEGLKIASGKKITVTATECDIEQGEFVSNGITVIKTMPAAATYLPGEIIAEMAFDTACKKWAKVTVACDDTAATGSIKVIGDVRG